MAGADRRSRPPYEAVCVCSHSLEYLLVAASLADGRARARPDQSTAFLARRSRPEGDRRLRAGDDFATRPEVRAAAGAHRHVRPGRHLVGRASDVPAGHVLPGPRADCREGEAGTGERRAVQDRALRQPRGYRAPLDGRPPEDRRCNAQRHAGRDVPQRRQEMDRAGEGFTLETAVHRAHLRAHAGGPEIPARERLQDLHRHRRRPGLRARLLRARVRHSRRSRSSARPAAPSTGTTRTGSRS